MIGDARLRTLAKRLVKECLRPKKKKWHGVVNPFRPRKKREGGRLRGGGTRGGRNDWVGGFVGEGMWNVVGEREGVSKQVPERVFKTSSWWGEKG